MFGMTKQDVREAVREALEDEHGPRKTITKLREEIETLRIEKGRKEEEAERREREVEHKVGLERKRQEFEVEQAKRETVVTLREENLTADRKRFEEEMAFTRDRFKEEVGYLKDMVGKVLERLPSAEIITTISKGK